MANTNSSYVNNLVEAIKRGDRVAVDHILTNALQAISEELVAVIENHPTADLPLLIASMRITASAFESQIPDSGKFLAKGIVESATAIVFKSGDIRSLINREE